MGPGTSRNDMLDDQRERDGVYCGMIQRGRVTGLLDRMISDRKQLMKNTVMHRQPVQLPESGGDKITLSLPHHDPSSCVLECLQSLDLRLWQSSQETVAIVQPGHNRADCNSVSSFACEQ